MSTIFKNIFNYIDAHTRMNFKLLANVRRAKLEAEGLDTGNVNWEHYAKVLEAKHEQLRSL
jgi:hypothetical protein